MLILYFFLLVVGTGFAYLSQTKYNKITGKVEFHWLPFIASFLIVLYYTGFTNSGNDYDNYYEIIDFVTWEIPIFGTSEIGFNIFCVALKEIFKSPDIVIFVIKTLTLFLVYLSLYLLKDHVSIWYSYFVYILLFWLPSLFVIPLFLSSSMCLLAFTIFFLYKKKITPIILILLAAQIHTATYFASLFYFFIFF